METKKPEKSTPKARLNGQALTTSRRDCGLRNATIVAFNEWLGSECCRELMMKLIPDFFCDIPMHYNIKAIHATVINKNDKKPYPYLMALQHERGSD